MIILNREVLCNDKMLVLEILDKHLMYILMYKFQSQMHVMVILDFNM